MQIRLLGTIDVDLDDRPLKLAGPEQRAMLSMLALSANSTVSVERLVEGLWGEEPPPTAANMVQQYVSPAVPVATREWRRREPRDPSGMSSKRKTLNDWSGTPRGVSRARRGAD